MAIKASDEKLKSCLMEISEQEDDILEKEMQDIAPYTFSDEFEQKMNHILQEEKPDSIFTNMAHYITKVSRTMAVRYAAAVMVLLLTGGTLTFAAPRLCACSSGIHILEWLEHFFVVQEGKTSREENGVLFSESQIGYLPDGFEKVEEEIVFLKVAYRFQNEKEEYIELQVSKDKASLYIDSEEIIHNIGVNEAGFEYQYIYKEDSGIGVLTWADTQNIYYCLQTTLNKDDMIQIMNGILY